MATLIILTGDLQPILGTNLRQLNTKLPAVNKKEQCCQK